MTPIDETRYVSVAWEMWYEDSWLLPLKNGSFYADKPPLFFWLVHLGWAVVGVNDIWPRLISPLFAAGASILVWQLARQLWPSERQIGADAALLLISMSLWLLFATAVMFDVILTFWVLLSVLGLIQIERRPSRGIAMLAIGVGFGVLTKGPVVMLHLLPLLVGVKVWRESDGSIFNWVGKVGLGLISGAVIPLLWLGPAIWIGGEGFMQEVLWEQNFGRVKDSFAHQRAFWWYVVLLPLLLLPISLSWKSWRHLVTLGWKKFDVGARFCVIWALGALCIFSAVSGTQAHYLLPALPALALLWARYEMPQQQRVPVGLLLFVGGVGAGLLVLATGAVEALRGLSPVLPDFWPALLMVATVLAIGWIAYRSPYDHSVRYAVPTLGIALTLGTLMAFRPIFQFYYDVRPLAATISKLQADGQDIAHLGRYHAQYQFLGRLTKPLIEMTNEQMEGWLRDHPSGYVVIYTKAREDGLTAEVVQSQAYRGGRVMLMGTEQAQRYLHQKQLASQSAPRPMKRYPTPGSVSM